MYAYEYLVDVSNIILFSNESKSLASCVQNKNRLRAKFFLTFYEIYLFDYFLVD